MYRRMIIGAAVGLTVLGCQDTPEIATAPEFKPNTTSCNYPTLSGFARSLFDRGSAGANAVDQLTRETPRSAAATNLGFDVLAAIAAKRDTDGLTTDQTSDAANLTVEVIRCADVKVTGLNTVPAFSQALGPTGAYQVRGGTSTAGVSDPSTSVLALDKQAGIQAPGDDFAAWLGGRVLFYGYPIAPFFSGELTGDDAGLSGRVAFDWSLVAAQSVSLPRPTRGKFSLCVTVQDDDAFNQLRVQKTSHILEIAAPVTGLSCATSSASAEPLSLEQRLLAWGERLLAPAPLHAAALLRTGSPTGSAGSFSPFQVGNPLDVGMTFATLPRDGRAGVPLRGAGSLPVRIEAKGSKGTDWEGVLVRILGTNNNGTPTELLNNEATTDANGIATFPDLTVTKSGAIILIAITVNEDPDVEGFVPSQVQAPKINIRP